MVRVQHLESVPASFPLNGSGLVKTGGRTEYALPLDDTVRAVAEQLNVTMPLRFASVIVAQQTDEPDQLFHEDGTYDSINAIVYLTDVPDSEYGAIEFQTEGAILGGRGSAVIYNAREIHRGRSNRMTQERIALGLVFSNDERPIRTIGSTAAINTNEFGSIELYNEDSSTLIATITSSIPFTGSLSTNVVYTLKLIPNSGSSFLRWEGTFGLTKISDLVYSYTTSTNSPTPIYAVFGTGTPSLTCFFASAPVLTPNGYKKIASLKVGDLVTTDNGTPSAIQRVKVQRVAASPSTNPYSIPKGRFGATKRLLISPNHKVLVEGRGLVKASDLDLEQEPMSGELTYYNLELESWSNMIVAGVTVESLAPVRRVVVSLAVFKELVRSKYGSDTPELLQMISRTCRMLPGERVEIPTLNK